MGFRKNIAVICLAVLCFGLWPGGVAWAQDVRTLTVGSLRLSSGESSWLGVPSDLYADILTYQSFAIPALRLSSSPVEPLDLSPGDLAATDCFRADNSFYLMKQRVGQVFNLSVVLSNIKNLGLASSSNVRTMSTRAGSSPERTSTGGSDLWALDLGLDYRDPSGHGLHLGLLFGADPLTREADPVEPERQGFDLGYSYDLDGFYVNLGYVYTFSPVWTSAREDTPDSAFYLRFKLHF